MTASSQIEQILFDRRHALLTGAALASAGMLASGTRAEERASKSPRDKSGRSDFDFLHGSWKVHHRQIVKDKVIEFEGTSTTRPIAGGLGNLEEAVIRHPKGTYNGTALRLYDPKTLQWSIWWADDYSPTLTTPPVTGRFTNGVGILIATDPDNHNGMARFTWSHITPVSAVWDQATSEDSGATWVTSWHMEFRRV